MSMRLHEAISVVLRERGNVPMGVEEVAHTINERGLYVKRDGCKTDAYGVGLRAVSDVSKSGAPLFDVLIRLRK